MHENKRNKLLLIPMLIIANLYPLFGVIQYGWSLFSIVYIYWLEFLIISFFDGLKIIISSKPPAISLFARSWILLKFWMIRLFVFAFYLLFIIVFIGIRPLDAENTQGYFQFSKTIVLSDSFFRMSLLQFFIYNLFDFLVKFIITGRYKLETPLDNFNFFDRRIFVVHLSIFIGAFLYDFFVDKLHASAYHALLLCVSVFILIKIVPDIFLGERDIASTENNNVKY